MIDVTGSNDKCYAQVMGTCGILNTEQECSYKCPFYKPKGCKDWVRVGNKMYTPEEYEANFKVKAQAKHPCWAIRSTKKKGAR